jgi:hypothetical protein
MMFNKMQAAPAATERGIGRMYHRGSVSFGISVTP